MVPWLFLCKIPTTPSFRCNRQGRKIPMQSTNYDQLRWYLPCASLQERCSLYVGWIQEFVLSHFTKCWCTDENLCCCCRLPDISVNLIRVKIVLWVIVNIPNCECHHGRVLFSLWFGSGSQWLSGSVALKNKVTCLLKKPKTHWIFAVPPPSDSSKSHNTVAELNIQ